MVLAFKKCAVVASTAVLALTVPNMAQAQTALPTTSPQEVTIEIVTESFGIEVTVCVGTVC